MPLLLERSSRKFEMKVNPKIAGMLHTIFDTQQIERALKEQNIDIEKCPLGMLSHKQILEGYGILKKILKLMIDGQRTG